MMKRLTFILNFVLSGFVLFGFVTEQKKFKGDLYFKLISIGSYYSADSLEINLFEKKLDRLMQKDQELLSKDELKLVEIYGGLRKHGLIYKPCFDLMVDSVTTLIVYADPVEFAKVKDFKRDALIKEKKKVQIELTGEIVMLGELAVIRCRSIDNVEIVDGNTFWRK